MTHSTRWLVSALCALAPYACVDDRQVSVVEGSGGSIGSTGGVSASTGGVSGILCGNGFVDPGEDCDGTNLNGNTCASATGNKPFGNLVCVDCLFFTGNCFSAGSSSGGAGGGTGITDSGVGANGGSVSAGGMFNLDAASGG